MYVTIYVTTLCLQGLSFASAPWAEIASLDRRFFLRPSQIPFLCDRITQIEIGVHIWNLRALYIPKHPEFFSGLFVRRFSVKSSGAHMIFEKSRFTMGIPGWRVFSENQDMHCEMLKRLCYDCIADSIRSLGK